MEPPSLQLLKTEAEKEILTQYNTIVTNVVLEGSHVGLSRLSHNSSLIYT